MTSGSGPSWSASFNVQTNQISTNGYAYDAAGNLVNDGSHTYKYDGEGNLLTVDGVNTATYVYDGLNRRVSAGNAGGANEFMYDYAGRRISSWIASINFGDEGRIYWDGQQIAYRSWSSPTYFEHQDWLGTERARTDPSGNVQAGYTSLAFGDGNTQTVSGTNVDQDNNSFTSLELDPETETYHAQYRQYSPGAGSWMSPDPYPGSYDINNPQSFNRYSYVLDNPLTLTDPLGLDYGFDCGNNCVGVVGTDPQPCGEVGDCGFDGSSGPGSPSGTPGNLFPPINPPANNGRPPSNGRSCTPGPASAGQYVAATAEVGAMTSEFFSGLGPGDQTFGPGTATSQVMGQSGPVQDVLNSYYMTGQTSGLCTFGGAGYVAAGGNPVAQFVGSFRWSISGGNLSLTNTTSFRSLTYDMGPQWQRGSFPTPTGNTHQTYNISVTCH